MPGFSCIPATCTLWKLSPTFWWLPITQFSGLFLVYYIFYTQNKPAWVWSLVLYLKVWSLNLIENPRICSLRYSTIFLSLHKIGVQRCPSSTLPAYSSSGFHICKGPQKEPHSEHFWSLFLEVHQYFWRFSQGPSSQGCQVSVCDIFHECRVFSWSW